MNGATFVFVNHVIFFLALYRVVFIELVSLLSPIMSVSVPALVLIVVLLVYLLLMFANIFYFGYYLPSRSAKKNRNYTPAARTSAFF